MTPARVSSRLAPARSDVLRAPKSEETLSARARHRPAAQALAQLRDRDLLRSADAPGQELSRM
eukprot:2908381-Pleurochrysis_carterae.AAC.1